MNHSIRVVRWPRLAWPTVPRTGAALIATAALVSLAVACGGSPSSAGSNGSSNAAGSALSKALAYAGCMRSHAVPDFPDPNSSGEFDKAALNQLAATNSHYRTASSSCAHLLPASSSGSIAAEVRQEWNGMASFARCMRSHGVPNWPDPTPYPPDPSRATFNLPASIQPTSATISKMEVCMRLVPNNETVGHIDNNNWMSAQQQMAGM